MAQGVEWVGPAASPEEPSRVPPEVQDEVRELRDQVRRLQEQVNALAARPKAGGRIPTHVAGLDAALEGGIPRGHVVLLAGPTGAMKTSLALYAVVKNRAAGARGLYVTIEEGGGSLLPTARRLGRPGGGAVAVGRAPALVRALRRAPRRLLRPRGGPDPLDALGHPDTDKGAALVNPLHAPRREG